MRICPARPLPAQALDRAGLIRPQSSNLRNRWGAGRRVVTGGRPHRGGRGTLGGCPARPPPPDARSRDADDAATRLRGPPAERRDRPDRRGRGSDSRRGPRSRGHPRRAAATVHPESGSPSATYLETCRLATCWSSSIGKASPTDYLTEPASYDHHARRHDRHLARPIRPAIPPVEPPTPMRRPPRVSATRPAIASAGTRSATTRGAIVSIPVPSNTAQIITVPARRRCGGRQRLRCRERG